MPSGILPLKVLIVDDHFLARQIVADVMRKHGVGNITMASDGVEARDLIAKSIAFATPFDVVFLDWHMPVLEGIEVLRHFRAQSSANDIAFIMLTAAAEQREVLEAVRSGATGYIVKPASKEVIAKKFFEVLDWINKKRTEKGLDPLKRI